MRHALCLLATGCLLLAAADPDPTAWRAIVAEKVAAQTPAVAGVDGWCFVHSELAHYAEDPAWATAEGGPFAAITGFQAQCAKVGAVLVLVPVPGKTACYPERLDPRLPAQADLAAAERAFAQRLRGAGVLVVDLWSAARELRRAGGDSHCRSDSHWSPALAERAATLAADLLGQGLPWTKSVVRIDAVTMATPTDLPALLGLAEGNETLLLHQVRLDGKPVRGGRGSPLLVLGDSHARVYHELLDHGIQVEDAGFVDHLAARVGVAPELIANNGSGGNAPRATLARPPRHDNLAGIRAVVWVLRSASFTQELGGWREIPVVR